MSNKKNRRNFVWMTCFCADSRAAMFDEIDGKLVRSIQKGNLTAIERILKHLKQPLNNLTITVKRRHLSTTYPCLVDHRSIGTDPFINFYQECSPVIWAIDCLQWHVLPLLTHYGIDINRPQTCKRWTYICSSNSRPNTAPYRRFWTRGRYTYQSALDYFFASIYEFIGEQLISNYNGLNGPSPLTFYLSHLSTILTKGIDVHRIDSVIVFNSLAISYDQYLCHYTNENAIVPDIPENDDSFIEMITVKKLIENGFSQFECMDYLYPCCNWFGILICLICHPKIDTYQNHKQLLYSLLPSIIRQATLLLINLIILNCTFPNMTDFKESLENLHLRKIYSKRYTEYRDIFNQRLINLHQLCEKFIMKPLSLKILSRNIIRKQIGGINFLQKLSTLNLPTQLIQFIQYVNQEHLLSNYIPKFLIHLVQGEWIEDSMNSIYSNMNSSIDNTINIITHHDPITTTNTTTNDNNNNSYVKNTNICDYNYISSDFYRQLNSNTNDKPILRRGRASERQYTNYQRKMKFINNNDHNYITDITIMNDNNIDLSNHVHTINNPMRPTSAPLPRTNL